MNSAAVFGWMAGIVFKTERIPRRVCPTIPFRPALRFVNLLAASRVNSAPQIVHFLIMLPFPSGTDFGSQRRLGLAVELQTGFDASKAAGIWPRDGRQHQENRLKRSERPLRCLPVGLRSRKAFKLQNRLLEHERVFDGQI